jgi:hypothetical protein
VLGLTTFEKKETPQEDLLQVYKILTGKGQIDGSEYLVKEWRELENGRHKEPG